MNLLAFPRTKLYGAETTSACRRRGASLYGENSPYPKTIRCRSASTLGRASTKMQNCLSAPRKESPTIRASTRRRNRLNCIRGSSITTQTRATRSLTRISAAVLRVSPPTNLVLTLLVLRSTPITSKSRKNALRDIPHKHQFLTRKTLKFEKTKGEKHNDRT